MYPCGGEKGTRLKEIRILKTEVRMKYKNSAYLTPDNWILLTIMLAKRIIPCLDVKDGRVVKGVNFLNLQDAGDPVENARFYDSERADELVFLDITASHERRKIILDVVARTASDVFMPLTVGGGIRDLEDIRNLLNAGSDKVSINTAAVQDQFFVQRAAERFGSQCIVVAIDAKRRPAN